MSIEYGSVAGYGVSFDEDDEFIGKFIEQLSGSDAHKKWKEENDIEDDEYFCLEEIYCSEHVEILRGGNFVGDYGYEYLFVVPGGDNIKELQENIPAYLEEMKKYIPDITEENLSIVHATWVG